MDFIDRITTKNSIQEQLLKPLATASREVIIYGAGVYSYVLSKYLKQHGIAVTAFLIDKEYVTSDTYLNCPVMTFQDVKEPSNYEVVIGITNYEMATVKLSAMGFHNTSVIDVPDFLNIPALFMSRDYVLENLSEFEKTYLHFEDELSRDTYIAAINTKVTNDLSYILPLVQKDHLYFVQEPLEITSEEVFLDVGGFNGDSIKEFYARVSGCYKQIISLEPFEDSFENLTNRVKTMELKNVELLKRGAWSEKTTLSFAPTEEQIDSKIDTKGSYENEIQVDKIDNILSDLAIDDLSFIKMDINGAEFEALRGALGTLRSCKPKIAIKMHVKEDFHRMVPFLKREFPEMKLYLRQRNYMSMMLVLYGFFE